MSDLTSAEEKVCIDIRSTVNSCKTHEALVMAKRDYPNQESNLYNAHLRV